MRGIQDLYVLVFLCLHSRQVIVTTSTKHPSSAWVKMQIEMFIERTKDRKEKPSIVMHGRDTKLNKEFVATLKAKDIRTNALPVASPNLNGHVERFIQTLKCELPAQVHPVRPAAPGSHRGPMGRLLQYNEITHGT